MQQNDSSFNSKQEQVSINSTTSTKMSNNKKTFMSNLEEQLEEIRYKNREQKQKEAQLNYIDIDENAFKIINKDTGETYDIRQYYDENIYKEPTSQTLLLTQQQPWTDWWQKKKENNQKFIQFAKQNDYVQCIKQLDKKLADLKADINTKDLETGETALHFACQNKNLQLVQQLLFYEANIDSLNKNNQSPLIYACLEGNEEIMQVLINAGADLNLQDGQKNSPFHFACMKGNKQILDFLLKRPSLKVQIQNEKNQYPIDLIVNQDLKKYISNEIKQREQNQKKDEQFAIINTNDESINEMFTLPQSRPEYQSQIQQKSQHLYSEKIGPNSFLVHGLIGKGAFGEVYLVEKSDTQKLYAMKVLHKSKINKQNLGQYAMSERNILSFIQNPFIVHLSFAFQTQDKLFLILQYCPGGDLGELLKKEKRLSEELTKSYIAEIILALEFLHSKDIIFRDLKPDNIVLDQEGHAMITDFGLSKEGINDQCTGAKSFCGSYAYLAPEILKQTGHGKAVDWYLLGVLMYELLVGVPPYYASNREELFKNIENGQLKIPDGLSNEAKSLLKSLLQRNPVKRLGSGKGDAEEIKIHPFFNNINWKDVYERKLKVIIPNRHIRLKTQFDYNVFEPQSFVEKNKQHVTGWSFVNQASLIEKQI